MNYFLGIDAVDRQARGRLRGAQIAQGARPPSLNHPITGNTAIAIGTTWHHAAATYDGTTWNLYLDGVADGSLAVGRVPNTATNALTAVGSSLSTTGATSGFFAGVVDEVRIWSVARTAAQIAAAKNTEITGAQAGLMGRWGLNEASGTTAADSSGNAITGNLVATPTRAAGFNVVAAGPQYVTFGAAPGLNAATYTLELWFNRTGAGVGTSTGTGGIASAIPLLTKGRAEAETPANLNMDWFLGIDATTGQLVADFEDTATGANHPVTGTAVVTSNVWHHAAATYGAGTWNLYLDGVLDKTLAVGAFTPEATSIQHAALGTAMTSTGVAAGFFQGVVDEARVWNVVRTGAEIAAAKYTEITAPRQA